MKNTTGFPTSKYHTFPTITIQRHLPANGFSDNSDNFILFTNVDQFRSRSSIILKHNRANNYHYTEITKVYK